MDTFDAWFDPDGTEFMEVGGVGWATILAGDTDVCKDTLVTTYYPDLVGIKHEIIGPGRQVCVICCAVRGPAKAFVKFEAFERGLIEVRAKADDRAVACGSGGDDGERIISKYYVVADCARPSMKPPGSLCPDGVSSTIVEAHADGGRAVVFYLKDNEEGCKIKCLSATKAKITAGTEQGNGKVIVVAQDCAFPRCKTERVLRIGCSGGCDSGRCGAGDHSASLNSMYFEMGLGDLADGDSAGSLLLAADYASKALASPATLDYEIKPGMEVWGENDPNSGFQIKSAQVLASIERDPNIAHGYRVDFYTQEQVSDWQDPNGGPWFPFQNEIPITSYTIECPDAPASYARVLITRFVDGVEDVEYEYVHSETWRNVFKAYDTTWTLNTKRNGQTARTETLNWIPISAASDPNEPNNPIKIPVVTWESRREVVQDGGTWLNSPLKNRVFLRRGEVWRDQSGRSPAWAVWAGQTMNHPRDGRPQRA